MIPAIGIMKPGQKMDSGIDGKILFFVAKVYPYQDVYCTTDGGNSFNKICTLPDSSSARATVSIAANGQKIIIVNYSSSAATVHVSTNYGQSFFKPSYSFGGASMGYVTPDGNYFYVPTRDGMCRSADNGINWILYSGRSYDKGVASTYDGQEVFVNTNYWRTICDYSSNYGTSWTRINGSDEGQYWACSSDGIKLLSSYSDWNGGGLCIFNNGISGGYTTISPGQSGEIYNHVHCSFDGQNMLAVGDSYTYISNDGGSSWFSTGFATGTYVENKQIAVMSGSGKYVYITNNYTIYKSSDYGNTFTALQNPKAAEAIGVNRALE